MGSQLVGEPSSCPAGGTGVSSLDGFLRNQLSGKDLFCLAGEQASLQHKIKCQSQWYISFICRPCPLPRRKEKKETSFTWKA